MSWLLTDREFRAARTAVRTGELTPALHRFLIRLVGLLARTRMLPPGVDAGGRWSDDAVEEAMHAWFADKLATGGLLQAFDRTQTPQALARYLERSFRNWLVDRARRQGRPRLLIRTRDLFEARTGEFRKVADAPEWIDDSWGLATWEAPRAYAGGDDELVRLMYVVPALRLLRTGSGWSAPPIVGESELRRLVMAVFEGIQETLTLRQLDRAYRRRFAFAYDERALTFDDQLSGGARPDDRLETIEDVDAIREILTALSGRQLSMLQGRARGLTLEQLAADHGCSRGTADNEVRRASAVIRNVLEDDDAYERTLEILFALTFAEGE